MQASVGSQDSVLKQLRSGRREVADELLKFGKPLSQSKIHKTQKGIVGIKWQRKAEDSGGKWAESRHKLILHVTGEMGYNCSCIRSASIYKADGALLGLEMMYYLQTQSFQALDHATRERTKGPRCHARQYRPSGRLYRLTDPQIEALHEQTERTH